MLGCGKTYTVEEYAHIGYIWYTYMVCEMIYCGEIYMVEEYAHIDDIWYAKGFLMEKVI